MSPIDPATDPSKEVYNHGMALDDEYKRVQCCYCGKVVPGFSRLQQHLGAISGNVTECPSVLEEVKKFFRDSLLSAKFGKFVKEVGDLCSLSPPSKRTCTSNSKSNATTSKITESGESMNSNSSKKATCNSIGSSSSQYANFGNFIKANGKNSKRGQKPSFVNSNDNNRFKRSVCTNNDSNGILASQDAFFQKEGQTPSSIMAKRCIGRFFFENHIDFRAVTSHSFKCMMEISLSIGQTKHSIPSVKELKGWILDDELKETQNYVNEIRASWSQTGCSILLDVWTDEFGRNLMNVIVDSPNGPIYLKSSDITTGANVLEQFLDSVLDEIGIHNVVQIIAHTFSESLEAISKNLVEKYRSLFWTVSPSHCISLMLDKISLARSIEHTLYKAKTITTFIYSRGPLLKLLRRHITCDDLVKFSEIKVAACFLTLENFLLEKSSLELMFSSSEWLNSSWALTAEGKMAANLIGDNAFWDDVILAVKASIPLVRAISLINDSKEPNIGFIYEIMDQVKETISGEFHGKKSQYTPYWKIIDDIWNTILHSPLHAAGYFLNPRLRNSEDFYLDMEVFSGLMVTIVRMVEGQAAQDLVCKQVKIYEGWEGDFEMGTADKRHCSLSPVAWWTRFGTHCPELQKLALKILSQTCKGADSYGLRRDVAEKLLSNSRNPKEQQRLHDLAYVHYNLHLKQFKTGAKFNIASDEGESFNDWITHENQEAENHSTELKKEPTCES